MLTHFLRKSLSQALYFKVYDRHNPRKNTIKTKKRPAYLTSKQVAILLPLAYLSLRARARAFSVFLKWSLAVSLKTSGPNFLMSLAAKTSTLAPAPDGRTTS